jgi:hypothetical protein
MQLLFSFDQAMKVEKTLMQTLACQLSYNSYLLTWTQAAVISKQMKTSSSQTEMFNNMEDFFRFFCALNWRLQLKRKIHFLDIIIFEATTGEIHPT